MNFNVDTYKKLLGYKESGGNYNIDTGNGAYGKYQFLYATIVSIAKKLNEPIPTVQQFLNSPAMQERYLKALIEDSLLYIQNNNLTRYEGMIKEGQGNKIKTEINLYGLVAGIHLGGAYNLKNYLEKGIDKADSLGTYISDYVTLFSKKIDLKKKTIDSNNGIDTNKLKECLNMLKQIENKIIELKNILNKMKIKVNE